MKKIILSIFVFILFYGTISRVDCQLYSGLGRNSLYFDYYSWIQLPLALNEELGREFTFECWFQVGPVADTRNNPNPGNWGSSVPGYSALNRPLVARWRSVDPPVDNAYNDFDLQINPEGYLQFFMGGGLEERNLGVFVEAAERMESNRWYHVAVSVLYSPLAIDALPQSALLVLDHDWSGAHVIDYQFANWRVVGEGGNPYDAVRQYLTNETIYIGYYRNNDVFWPNGQRFVGMIDEIRFWNGIRLESEVELYLNESVTGDEPWLTPPGLFGKPGFFPGQPDSRATLVAAYNLNEGSGTIAHDQGPYGFDGTITNPIWEISQVYIYQYYYLLHEQTMEQPIPMINIVAYATGGDPNPLYTFTITFNTTELGGILYYQGVPVTSGSTFEAGEANLEFQYQFNGTSSGLYKFFYLVQTANETAWVGYPDQSTEVRIVVDLCTDGGDAIDACGICNGNNKSVDCFGICNGTAVADACGVCNGTNTTCIGCDGVLNSGKKYDACGVCGGNNSTCLGCDGVPNSNKTVDYCGVCGGKNRTLDACGVCNGTNSTCVGCDNVPYSGLKYDLCGVCNGNNSCLGCDGIPFSNKTYDVCGVCGGNNSTCGGCDGLGGNLDACGVCDGDNSTCMCVIYKGFTTSEMDYLLFSYTTDQIAFKISQIENLLLLILEDLQYYSGPGDMGVVIQYLNSFCVECLDGYNEFLDEFIGNLYYRINSLPPTGFIPQIFSSSNSTN